MPPDASPVILALRSLGYMPETAVADLIDNSLDAAATEISVDIVWAAERSYIRVADNGTGMDERTLVQAMRLGSKDPLGKRGKNELGRFGIGLKTASFSLGKRLTVMTKRHGKIFIRCWDLDVVRETNQWQLKKQAFSESLEALGKIDGPSGTVVLIEHLDRFAPPPYTQQRQRKFFDQAASIERHLQLVFHRFLEGPGRINLWINENPVIPWDPFWERLPITQEMPEENLTVDGASVRIRGYILPHHSRLTEEQYLQIGGPKNWFDQQGFYIYRNKRLLVAGGWLGRFPKEESTKLARIRVDFDQSADFDWQIDVKKSVARPPQGIADHLWRCAEQARKLSHRAYYHRGVKTQRGKHKPAPAEPDLLWSQVFHHGMPRYVINQEHRLLREIREKGGQEIQALLAVYLTMLQEFSPANAISFAPAPPPGREEVVISDADREEMLAFAPVLRDKLKLNSARAAGLLKEMPIFVHYAVQEIERVIKEVFR